MESKTGGDWINASTATVGIFLFLVRHDWKVQIYVTLTTAIASNCSELMCIQSIFHQIVVNVALYLCLNHFSVVWSVDSLLHSTTIKLRQVSWNSLEPINHLKFNQIYYRAYLQQWLKAIVQQLCFLTNTNYAGKPSSSYKDLLCADLLSISTQCVICH